MTAILIIGESGSGKTASTRNLDPKETFIISIGTIPKPLSYKSTGYKLHTKEKEGNLFYGDKANIICKALEYIQEKRKEIKTVIIDDFQYLMSNEFMNRVSEKGYDKFSEIGKNAWEVINTARMISGDINVYIMGHSDVDINGKSKLKTIGKMLDDKVCLEGLFTIVLHAMVIDNNRYMFLTQNNGMSIAKSPMGLFESLLIENDLKIVNEKINKYYELETL